MAKMLVTYFSPGGVTKKVAEKIAALTGADLYEILPEEPYTDDDLDWTNSAARSNVEMADKDNRPSLAAGDPKIDQYDTVVIGCPVWWGIAPHVVNTFIETFDVTSKTIVPFITSGGTPAQKTEDSYKELYPECKDLRGCVRFTGNVTEDEIKAWLGDLI